jgi:membrane associated rhomboid family serine protease
MVGASGAIFGLLLAFGMLFPNAMIYIYFFFPMKAKWFVILYGAMELFLGVMNEPGDNVAHFAHLGGMVFGFILIKYWQKKDRDKFVSLLIGILNSNQIKTYPPLKDFPILAQLLITCNRFGMLFL